MNAAESALRVLRAQAAALTEAIEALASTLQAPGDELLGITECRTLGVGRDALIGAVKRGELVVSKGPRGKLLVRRSALEAWLSSKPYTPKASEPAVDMAAWERSVRRAS